MYFFEWCKWKTETFDLLTSVCILPKTCVIFCPLLSRRGAPPPPFPQGSKICSSGSLDICLGDLPGICSLMVESAQAINNYWLVSIWSGLGLEKWVIMLSLHIISRGKTCLECKKTLMPEFLILFIMECLLHHYDRLRYTWSLAWDVFIGLRLAPYRPEIVIMQVTFHSLYLPTDIWGKTQELLISLKIDCSPS